MTSSSSLGPVPLFDGTRQTAPILAEIQAAMARVIASQHFILGAEVTAFEREVAAFLGVEHALGVSSGTDALLLALLSLGIGPGDEVITTPFSFFATTGAILRVGATPVFADIGPRDFNLNPHAVERAITQKTKAILPVHLFGQPAEMGALRGLADAHRLVLIEDAAQAFGATCSGRAVGTWGEFGCFSFFPTKNLGAFGDAGLVVTSDAKLAAKARSLRSHGFSPKHHSRELGGNFRLDALQAAVLRVKLPHTTRWNALRRQHAAYYARALSGVPGLVLPEERAGCEHVYGQFVVRVADPDALASTLAARKIGSERYYPYPIHLQQVCAHLGHGAGDFPEAEACARECLALPIFPELEPAMLAAVSSAVRAHFGA